MTQPKENPGGQTKASKSCACGGRAIRYLKKDLDDWLSGHRYYPTPLPTDTLFGSGIESEMHSRARSVHGTRPLRLSAEG